MIFVNSISSEETLLMPDVPDKSEVSPSKEDVPDRRNPAFSSRVPVSTKLSLPSLVSITFEKFEISEEGLLLFEVPNHVVSVFEEDALDLRDLSAHPGGSVVPETDSAIPRFSTSG
jgi:hypothetical protein